MTRLGRQTDKNDTGNMRRNILAAVIIAVIVAVVWFGSGWLLDKRTDVGWQRGDGDITSQE